MRKREKIWTRAKSYTLENRWTFLTIIITLVMLAMIGRNVIHAITIYYQISILKSERDRYQESITKDSTIVESLKYDEELERYAREKFFMQRKNEEIFIFE